MSDKHQSLEITAALSGGYIVWAGDQRRGEYRAPLYAGPLREALDFAGRAIMDNEAPKVTPAAETGAVGTPQGVNQNKANP